MGMHRYTATCPAGVGVYLAQELAGLGAVDVVERPIGVQFWATWVWPTEFASGADWLTG